jgi:hypothetical protein
MKRKFDIHLEHELVDGLNRYSLVAGQGEPSVWIDTEDELTPAQAIHALIMFASGAPLGDGRE